MVRLRLAVTLQYEIAPPGCDFVFNIHAAHTRHQTVVQESLSLSQTIEPRVFADPFTGNRYMRLAAKEGVLSLGYTATVDLTHYSASPEDLPEVPVANLPLSVLGYVYPSRYCQSDRLYKLAMREFGHLYRGYSRVLAIRDWVNRRVRFSPATSNSNTSAVDTLLEEVGVCRDFAHLMIALCRAVNLPARFATGIDYGANPILGPTDFHAYVEVFLGDRWYIFDPSGTAIPMGFVRFGTGRDAADVSFATMFGTVRTSAPDISIEAVDDAANGFQIPYHRSDGLSTAEEISWG